MRLIEVQAETSSPIVVVKGVEAGRYYTSHPILLGSQLYGALLKSVMIEKKIPSTKIQGLLQCITVTSGFPLHVHCKAKSILDRTFVPPPAISFSCKICDKTKRMDWKKIGTEIEEIGKEIWSLCCDDCGSNLFEASGKWACQGCGEEGLTDVLSLERRTSVGINPKTGTSYPEENGGLLFTYDAIPPNREFAFSICVEEEYENLLMGLEGKSIFVGRRISSGFGELKLKRFESLDLRERIEKTSEGFGSSILIEFLSPAFSLALGEKGLESKCEINWSTELQENYEQVYKKEIEVEVREMGFFGKTAYVDCGFSQFHGTRRPKILSISPGSVMRLKLGNEKDAKALACAKFLGSGFYKHFGYGQVRIVESI
jgi:hypothetical protein